MARRKQDPREPVSVWSERDMLGGKPADALVVILRSRGCHWSKQSGCLMCGYNNDCLASVTSQNMVAQFERAMEKHDGQEYIKIYTSGSFLDPGEVEPAARDSILGMAGERARRVLVESRPEFVTPVNLEGALAFVRELEVAMGLETADDAVRARCVNKGFGFADYSAACKAAREAGASIRTYLLLKPPYLSESAAIADVVESARLAGPMSGTVSVNPVNVQRGTVVEKLWREGLYRPPWLWSLALAMERASGVTDARVISSPSGGGSRRGVHNCGQCDDAFLKTIAEFSLGGALELPGCDCRERWLDYLDIEPFSASAGDLERLFRPQ